MNKTYCPYCMTAVPDGESCSQCGLTSGNYVPSPHHLPPGTVLMERYLVGRVLGEGGFGITYIGRDLRLELKVAIKEYYPVDRATRNSSASLEVTNFIGPSAKSFERGKQKFLGEAQVMARMDKQQTIVSVRDFFEINNTAYIVMEYVEGITFRELVEKKGGKIPPEELFPMIEPLFHALSTVHANGLIHRDISPDNLMLENGRIRLLDFGCAREASHGTETMTIALKHGYAPIEQYQQKGQGSWTDIYALSATIYYCLTGKIPPQALDRITGDELLLPSKLGISLSVEQEKALLKGMKLQPNRRFATAEDMWIALYAKSVAEAKPSSEKQEKQEQQEKKAKHEKQEKQEKQAGEAQDKLSPKAVPEPELPEPELPKPKPPAKEMQSDLPKTEVLPDSALAAAEEAKPEPPNMEKKKKIIASAGIVAACAALAIGTWAWQAGAKNGNSPNGESQKPKSSMATDKETAGTSYNFDNASTFTSGKKKDFQKLMEDDLVPAIIIDCDNIDIQKTTIKKPVLLVKGRYWNASYLVVAEGGYLQVEGHLDMTGSSYLRLMGTGTRLFIADSGQLGTEDSFLWMDDASCLVGKGSSEISAHTLYFSENVFDTEATVSVKDFPSLQQAAERKQSIRIDADITLTEDIEFCSPVQISEGVTVQTMEGAAPKQNWHNFCFGKGGVLINNGTIHGTLIMREKASAINNHVLAMEAEDCASLWVEDESTVINFGTIDAEDTSRFWDGSLFLNMGTLNAYDFVLIGGHMGNLGDVVLPEKRVKYPEWISSFWIHNGSWLWNKKGATVTVADSGEFRNNSRICNQGDIVIESNGHFCNTLLENDGLFQAKDGAWVDWDRAGIYYGAGQFDLGNLETAGVKVYATAYYDPEKQDNLVQAKNAEELEAALENPDATAVCIKADVTMDKELTIRKMLLIDRGCSLTMANGAKLLDYGAVLAILDGATLQAGNLALYEDAQIYMAEGSNLIVDKKGKLTLDSSLLWGRGGKLQITGANFLLKNEASFALRSLDSFETDNSKITLQNRGVFVTPDNGTGSGWEPSSGLGTVVDEGNPVSLSHAKITLKDSGSHSYFHASASTIAEACTLKLDADVFFTYAKNLTLRNCQIAVGENAEFNSDCSNLWLISGTTLENHGYVSLNAWDEYKCKSNGAIANYGDMWLNLSIDLSEPINNQGKLYYNGSEMRRRGVDITAYVTGNAPIDNENE